MSNFECTVTIADIYGAEWWERNKAELDREWEWEFGIKRAGDRYAMANLCGITVGDPTGSADKFPRIILHRRKPKPPTLREVYGADEVTIPVGWEWTGEFCPPLGFTHLDRSGGVAVNRGIPGPRLILRERPKKVWFKAECSKRCPNAEDYVWTSAFGWHKAGSAAGGFLCATRHEEVDQTVQVVTQADIDKAVPHA